MSSSTQSEDHPNLHTGETYREKALRKLKEQPFVPIGAVATTGALVMAMVQMKRGNSRSLNNWLRVRVIAQSLTVAAICVGTWALSHEVDPASTKTRQIDEIQARRGERQDRERVEFEGRLKEAEVVWAESQGKEAPPGLQAKPIPTVGVPASSPSGISSGSSWWGWLPWQSSGQSQSSPTDPKKA